MFTRNLLLLTIMEIIYVYDIEIMLDIQLTRSSGLIILNSAEVVQSTGNEVGVVHEQENFFSENSE